MLNRIAIGWAAIGLLSVSALVLGGESYTVAGDSAVHFSVQGLRLENLAVAWLLVHLAVLRTIEVDGRPGGPHSFLVGCFGLGLAAWFLVGAARAGQLTVWPWQLWGFSLTALGAFAIEAWRVEWPERIWAAAVGGALRTGLSPFGAAVLVIGAIVLWQGTVEPVRWSQEDVNFKEWFKLQSKPSSLTTDPTVQVVEFVDYQCPACRIARRTMDGILAERSADVRSGRVAIASHDFPLENECNAAYRRLGAQDLHPAACEAAAAVRMLESDEHKAQLREWLWSNQARLSRAAIAYELAVGYGIDFDTRYDEALKEVEADVALGDSRGVTGTPAVWLNGVRIDVQTSGNLAWAFDWELGRSREATSVRRRP